MSLIIAAISLGFLGSFHCIGMCGPIALALPVHQFDPVKKYIAILLYNIGRIITYVMLGLLFGLLGKSFSMAGFQQWISITIGIVLLLSVLMPGLWFFKNTKIPFLTKAISKLKSKLPELLSKKGLRYLFLIGILNGLLPCGLVYIGIAGAIASQEVKEGALFMFGFGLGTLPAMYAVAVFGQFISIQFRTFVRRSVPFVITTMALLLILRGLNLGIPYLSPIIDAKEESMSCCSGMDCEKQ